MDNLSYGSCRAQKSEGEIEAFIKEVVFEFYSKATTDILIGHQFRKISKLQGSDPLSPPMEGFKDHLPRIIEFWKVQLLQTKSNENFDLIKKHNYLMIRKGELDRWIVLFLETLDLCKKNFSDVEGIENFSKEWKDKVLHFQSVFQRFNKK